MPTLTPDAVRRGAAAIALARTGLGLALLGAPRTTRRLAGLDDSEVTPAARVMTGLFAVREIVLGATVLERVRAGYPSTALLRINAACDAGDFVVLLGAMGSRGRLGRLRLGMPTAAAISAVWLVMARSLDEAG